MSEIIHSILLFFEELGYWGILLGLMIEIIPSEIVLSYGGFLIHRGEIGFFGAVVFGVIGGTIAQIFVYWVGRYGGRPFLEKYGKYILIHKKHIDLSEKWFDKYGAGVIFTARFIPVVRHAISIPAGIARMPLWKFTLYTVLAIIPWSIFFIYLGASLGDQWESIDEKAAPYVEPFIWLAAGLMIAYFMIKWLQSRKKKNNGYGVAGEKSTAHQLKFLGREYKVLHGRVVQAGGNKQEFDHLIVGPNGLFHIETKNWSGQIIFTKDGVERSRDGDHKDPTAQLYRHEYILKELFREHHIRGDIVGILCFAHPDAHIEGKSPAFTTVKLDRLLHSIHTYQAKKRWSMEEVRRIERLLLDHSKSGS